MLDSRPVVPRRCKDHADANGVLYICIVVEKTRLDIFGEPIQALCEGPLKRFASVFGPSARPGEACGRLFGVMWRHVDAA